MPNRIRWEAVGLVVAFFVVHGVLALLAVTMPNQPIGDVELAYRGWIERGQHSGMWIGIDAPWVYPIAAMGPMLLAAAFGTDAMTPGWLALMTLLDGFAVLALWRHRVPVGRFRVRVSWWWLVFLLALGSIGVGRIDTPATALALVGVTLVAARPAIASALFTLAAWIKVWPAVLVAVLVVLRRHHRVAVVGGALAVTGVVVLVDVLFGGAPYLLSFIGQQTGRALQIESPLATPFMWAVTARVPGAAVYYDQGINTFEVAGAGTHVAARLSTPLMVLVVLAALVLGVRAVADGVRRTEVAPLLAMVLVGALVVTNKVGSPQYIGWYAVPIVWGLIAGAPSARRFLPAAVAALPMAFLTQLIYPSHYDRVLAATVDMVTVLTVRNALEVALLVWAIVAL
ncbi:MAG: DUF2029 domain-containing protein, partial [Williamsia herbipolensis]|nr:DUF2029 domain-containing protein [Williamsia herbipolensis]